MPRLLSVYFTLLIKFFVFKLNLQKKNEVLVTEHASSKAQRSKSRVI